MAQVYLYFSSRYKEFHVPLGRPKPGDTVLVKSQGKLKDGTIVDDYPTLVFNIGEYEVVDGLDLVVQSMYKNELSIVSIKPELAYGEKGLLGFYLCYLKVYTVPNKSYRL